MLAPGHCEFLLHSFPGGTIARYCIFDTNIESFLCLMTGAHICICLCRQVAAAYLGLNYVAKRLL